MTCYDPLRRIFFASVFVLHCAVAAATVAVAEWRRHLPSEVGHFRVQQHCHVSRELGLERKLRFDLQAYKQRAKAPRHWRIIERRQKHRRIVTRHSSPYIVSLEQSGQ